MSGSAEFRSRSDRQLGNTESAQLCANTNPDTHAEASDHSTMDNSQLLELAFGDMSVTNSSSMQPGTWAADLAFLISDVAAAKTYLESADLGMLNKYFSISKYLSPAGVSQVAPNLVLHKGQPIDGALLACLALNEECRKKCRGVFYHLPLRQNEEIGHAADLVFSPKSWTREDKYEWDSGGWSQRLDMYGVDKKCYGTSRTDAMESCPMLTRDRQDRQLGLAHPDLLSHLEIR